MPRRSLGEAGRGRQQIPLCSAAARRLRAIAQIQAMSPRQVGDARPIRIRAALHTGTADLQLGDYCRTAVNRAARLRAIAHGGQTIMSASTWELVRDRLPGAITVRDMGEHGLKDLTRPERVSRSTSRVSRTISRRSRRSTRSQQPPSS
jgi:class 3 adenylate cyclase